MYSSWVNEPIEFHYTTTASGLVAAPVECSEMFFENSGEMSGLTGPCF